MIKGIHHTAISVPDMAQALAFYRDLLGFELVAVESWEQGTEIADRITGLANSAAQVCLLRVGNAFLELFEYHSPTPKPAHPSRPVCDHGITHLCLEVTDIQQEYERLKAAGMRFHCPPQDVGSGIVTYGRDPFGNVIELQEITELQYPHLAANASEATVAGEMIQIRY